MKVAKILVGESQCAVQGVAFRLGSVDLSILCLSDHLLTSTVFSLAFEPTRVGAGVATGVAAAVAVDDHHTAVEARTAEGVAAAATVDRAAVAVVVEEVPTEEGEVAAVTVVPAGVRTVAGVAAAMAVDHAAVAVATGEVAVATLTGSRDAMLAHVRGSGPMF